MAESKIKKPVTKGVAKVSVIMQLEALECGAASLAMVMAYYQKWIPLEQVRVDCGVSRDGSNMKNVYLAALPETGGAGSESFYLIGMILTAAAATGFILRKRKQQ